MGREADAVTLQSRTINTGKGAAVRSKRIQADRAAYRLYMKHTVERAPHLELIQDEVTELLTEPMPDGRRRLCGVVTRAGETYLCRAAVICAGTYIDKNGNYHSYSEEDGSYRELVNNYNILQYNHLTDGKHRVEEIFTLPVQ